VEGLGSGEIFHTARHLLTAIDGWHHGRIVPPQAMLRLILANAGGSTEGEAPTVERRMDGREVFIEALNRHGVEYILGSPGAEWPPMREALSRWRAAGEPAPTSINCRHEGLAVGVAAGYLRATGQLPAVRLHPTSGGLNWATNPRGALHNSTPMLAAAAVSRSVYAGDGGE
jgi:Thiamine pyrophosphate enzyme, N-terminal TPP binding domain